MTISTTVELTLYRPEYLADLTQFHLPEEQLQFTALPVDSLEEALTDPQRYPIVIMTEREVVGFFVLHTGQGILDYDDYTDTLLAEVMLIRALLIDSRYQGKGYARQAMELLPAWVRYHFPFIHELLLAVNERNVAAQHTYTVAGFKDLGHRPIELAGPQRIMHYFL
ncbi:GNAT family N-acetyltransferase [Paenibacillus sp. KACC 21273]|uniref:GNAT family N-acetyltransferase n=1 Tax=Paenibacillus sp. KACC 21273 TaxID=3025665 RepID=UPI002365FE43|nr:GNAT family N-acetyltransferase [Paenibacillus sp. KACC 21273]WDF49056.1 GNAT family N-acetyltransferase [Paenibacillus sp. KACC 21273]